MENASKAVIMAGSVLIAVAVISLALYAFTSFRSYVEATEQLLTVSEIENFNRHYESYMNTTGTIRGVDAVNIYKKAIDDGFSRGTDIHVSNWIFDNIISDTAANPAANYLSIYNYSLDYDRNGKISEIRITL